jgi:hypothetical protein
MVCRCRPFQRFRVSHGDNGFIRNGLVTLMALNILEFYQVMVSKVNVMSANLECI